MVEILELYIDIVLLGVLRHRIWCLPTPKRPYFCSLQTSLSHELMVPQGDISGNILVVIQAVSRQGAEDTVSLSPVRMSGGRVSPTCAFRSFESSRIPLLWARHQANGRHPAGGRNASAAAIKKGQYPRACVPWYIRVTGVARLLTWSSREVSRSKLVSHTP